jgi:PilZ domain
MRVSAELVDSPREQRRAERRSTGIRSSMRARGSIGSLPVQVVDISTAGCRIEVKPAPYQGSTVWLKLPGLEAWCGSVAWVGNDCVGVEFSQPLHSAVVDRFLALRK